MYGRFAPEGRPSQFGGLLDKPPGQARSWRMQTSAPFLAPIHRLHSQVLAGILCALSGCSLSPTNPFDPQTPVEQQAKGSLEGTVALEAPATDTPALELELLNVRVGVVDENGDRLERDGAPLALALVNPGVAAGTGTGTFTFDALTPGNYTIVVDNVSSSYIAPPSASVRVLAGGTTEAGTLRYVLSASGVGPGQIVGEIDAAGAGQKSVSLFLLRSDGVRLVESILTSGSFSFPNLPVGKYAIVGEADGYTQDYRVDVQVGEGDDASLIHEFYASTALTLFPISAVLVPALDGGPRLDEGIFYVAGDELALAVLAFGGVTGMRLATNEELVDDAGDALPFVPFSAAATVPLPAREGPVRVFAQFEARSAGGFVFTSEVFDTSVVRDVSAPVLLEGTAPRGLERDEEGRFFAGASSGGAIALDVDAQDVVSAVDAVAVVVDPVDPDAALVFSDVTAGNGRVLLEQPVVLASDGVHTIVIAARDRAGNESERRLVTVVLDRSLPDVPLRVSSAVAGTQRTRAVQLTFDEAAATSDLPVAMQIGLQPLAPNAPLVPYETNTVIVVDPSEVAHGQVAAFEARLIDAAGNTQLVQSADVTFSLAARLAGHVILEGAPDLVPTTPAVVRALAGQAVLATGVVDVDGSWQLSGIPESDGVVVEASAVGWLSRLSSVGRVDAHDTAAAPTTVLDIELPVARGDITAAFRRQDLANDNTAHSGIGVSLTLTGSARRFADSAVTGPDGVVVFRDVPMTVPGTAGLERYLLVARADTYGAGSAETSVVAGNNVVQPDSAGAPTPILLPLNSGDFDVCAGGSGACVVSSFLGSDLIRVKLRNEANVAALRSRAVAAFTSTTSEGELPFVDITDPASAVLDLSAVDDGLVEIFVQTRQTDGSVSDVLSTIVTRDTVAPGSPDVTRVLAAGALDARFTRFGFVDVIVTGEPQIGTVAPLEFAVVIVADNPPSTVPTTGTACADGGTCRVALPGAPGPIEEKLHRLFAWSCDRAGNCSDADGSSTGQQPAESFVIVDTTAPSEAHGTNFDVGGADVVLVGAQRVLRSTLYTASIDAGAAHNALGDPVLDENEAAVADVWAYRLSLQQTAVDTSARSFEPTPTADETRSDVVAPPLPAQDGTHRLFARFIDAAGNQSTGEPNPFFRDVRIDTSPPLAAFRVESTTGNPQFTASTTVRVAVDVPPSGELPSLVEVDANDSLFDDDVDLAFPFTGNTNLISLPSGADGLYPLSARISDVVGNSTIVVDAIQLDRTGPAVLDLRCATCSQNDGVLYSRDVGGAATLGIQLVDVGAGAAQLRVTVGASPPQDVASTTTASIVLPLAQTTVVTVEGIDALGNATGVAGARSLTLVHDASSPNVVVSLGGGASRTSSQVVQVGIDATDQSALVAMELTTTGSFTGAFVPFSALTTLDLGNTDGAKTVQVRVQDAAGNIGTGSASIILDRQAPTASLLIANGAIATASQSVSAALTFDANDTSELLVSAVPVDCASATLAAATTSPFTTIIDVGQGDGTKTVFACVRDSAGNTRAVQDAIVLDTTAPPSSIALDNGASHSLDSSVDVVVSTASDVTGAVFSTSALDCATATYAVFTSGSTPTLSLPTGTAPVDGTRTVFACFRDAAGNTTSTSDSIVLDRFDPTGTLSIESGASFARSRTVSVEIATGIDVVLVAVDALPLDCATASYQTFSTPRIVTLADADGTQTVRACVKDAAGRTALLSDDVILDRAAPTGTVSVNGGAAITTARSVTVQVSYDADSVFVLASPVAVDCATAQSYVAATPPSSTIAVELLGGRGLQPVFGCFKDAAGNTSQSSDTIFFDESDVTGLTVAINGGAEFATNRNVLVTLIAPPDTTTAKIAEGGTLDCASPVGYAAFNASSPLPLTLSAGAAPLEGARIVSACIQQGTAAPLFAQDTITVDTFAPTGSLSLQSGATATNALQVIVSLTAATDVVDVSITNASTIDCASVTYEPFTATKAFALAGPDGSNTVRACLRDAAQNTVQVSDTITLDRVGPSPVSISVPSFVTTTSATATLTFPAGDTAQVAAAEGSLDCATTAAYVPATGSVAVALSAQDGTKGIVVCFKDAAGNTSQASAQTVLDTVDPSGSVVIDGGASFSTDTTLSLTLTAPADVTHMSIAENSNNCATATYVPFVAQPTLPISATQGTKTVAVCFRDLASRTSSATDSIVLDTAAPTGTLVIDAGAANANDRDVVLTITPGGGATDVVDMAVADGATLACASATYVAFAPALPHALPSGDGTKQIAACLRDRAGNVSAASFSSSIALDETPPNGSNSSLSIASGAAFTTSASVSLTLTFPSDVTQRAVANDGLDCASATYVSAGSSPVTIAGHALSSGDGNKLVVACVKDAAGNTFLVSDAISLDSAAPTGTVLLASGAAFSTAASTPITFTAPDDTSLAFVQVNGTAPTCSSVADASFTAFPATVALGSDGAKTVFACLRDAAGNRSAAAVSDGITLDTTVPAVTSYTAASLTNSQVVTLTIAASDTNPPLQMALGNNALNCGTASYSAFTSPVQHTILAAASTTVHLCVKDAAGNATATNGNTVTVSLDTTPPAGVSTVIQDGGDGFITAAGATTVQLNWSTCLLYTSRCV